MATKQQVLRLHRDNPKMDAQQIASRLGCLSAYVRATARRNGFSLPSAPRGPSEIARKRMKARRELGEAAIAAGLSVTAIKRLAAAR